MSSESSNPINFLKSLPPARLLDYRTMPRLGGDGEEEETLLEYGTKRTRRIVGGFLDFATQGNILEIAFGLM